MTIAKELQTLPNISQTTIDKSFTVTQESDNSQNTSESVIFPPGDLYSDEPPLESDLHLDQIMILLQCLKWLWRDRNDFYAAGNLTIYYSPDQRKSHNFRGPDFFVVLETERKSRKSWVVWEEGGKYPNVIVEILSASTANTDKGLKKKLYQNTFRTPDYFWYDPYTLQLAGFHLVDDNYEPIAPNTQGYLWSKQLGLFLGVHGGLLRYFTPELQMVLTPEETAKQAREREEEATQKSEKLAAKLRELNIDPETI